MSWQSGLYVAAILIPLAAFVVQLLATRRLGRAGAWIATAAIGSSLLLSTIGFVDYFFVEAEGVLASHAHIIRDDKSASTGEKAAVHHPLAWKASLDWIVLGQRVIPREGQSASPGLVIPLAVHIDNLAAIMFLMVTFIATLIHVYSIGYMHHDPGYPRFFMFLSLFCFSMLGLVASANVFMVFVFWELVGVCSYFLIGFHYQEKKSAEAANKAFIVNRIGDVGMLVGLGLLWTSLGTFDMAEINRTIRNPEGQLNLDVSDSGKRTVHLRDDAGMALSDPVSGKARQIPFWALTLAGLGIFAGCVGKSAQFPLHVWLPDAMAGPTPVSALIHAATMVAAGVYLVGRFFPIFTPDVLLYIAYTGGITLFIAATIATVQTDYKKVLAYSTVSQLGFMMLGLGVGGWAAGLFHLITHAFFKALLFLGAGSVYHAVHTYEMPRLGGLRKKLPVTAWTMLVGTLAISGVPLFSGFYSKDAILASSIYFVGLNPKHALLLILPVVGAALTAFYMFRMWFLVFEGTYRGGQVGEGIDQHGLPDAYEHAHESPRIMAWPLILLAIPSVVIGWPVTLLPIPGIEASKPLLERMLEFGEPMVRLVEVESAHQAHLLAVGASLLIATAGIGLGLMYYGPQLRYLPKRRFAASTAANKLPWLYRFLLHKWYFDETYHVLFVRPTLAFARVASGLDGRLIDGFVNATASVTVFLSRLEGVFDKLAVDYLVNQIARGTYALGDLGRGLQTGRLRNYLMFLAVALVGLFAGVFAWVSR